MTYDPLADHKAETELEQQNFAEQIRQKDWIADDDHIRVPDNNLETYVLWWTDSYIANTQIDALYADPDTQIGTIDPHDEHTFEIAIYPTSQSDESDADD